MPYSCFILTVSLQSAIPLSPLKISTKDVFLITAMLPTQQWSAQVCRHMLLYVLRLVFAFTGGTTPANVVNNPLSFHYKAGISAIAKWNHLFIFFILLLLKLVRAAQLYVLVGRYVSYKDFFLLKQHITARQTKFTSPVVLWNSQPVTTSKFQP